MLLAIDVGNTNTVLGVFQKNVLKKIHRFSTTHYRTADEWAMVLERAAGRSRGERTAALASVVPPVEPLIQQALENLGFNNVLVVRSGLKTGIAIHYDHPHEVGVDRVVNAVALKEMYGLPGIVVDFGTATTFDVVSARGEYQGGLIAPGIQMGAESLFHKTARLPLVEIKQPPALIGKNTVHSMQAGIFYGYVGLTEGILHRLVERHGPFPHIVSTGGLAPLLSPHIPAITQVNVDLTLWGLWHLYRKNA
jgi:type III pantothenate kinase